MAFAAARIIKDKKEQQDLKFTKTPECINTNKIGRKGNFTKPTHHQSTSQISFKPSDSTLTINKATRSDGTALRGINVRNGVKSIKKIKGKAGKPDKDELSFSESQIADLKEAFLLFDKDQDGILNFGELCFVMNTLGIRIADSRLLRHVREVSQDKVYDSIEFNEFLLLVSKHQEESLTRNSLLEAFRVFDPSGSGSVSFDCFHGIMSRCGNNMTQANVVEILTELGINPSDGNVSYEEFCSIVSVDRN